MSKRSSDKSKGALAHLPYTAAELRQMSEELGDNEFETEIAPFNNYTGGTPASKAIYHGLRGRRNFDTYGYTIPTDSTEEEMQEYREHYVEPGTGTQMPVERGTVVAIGKNAQNALWSHEYNHLNYDGLSESQNRFVDAITAPDKRSWDEAVMLQMDKSARRGRIQSRGSAERELVARLQQSHTPDALRPFSYSPARGVYKQEIARGGKVPKSMQTPNLFMEYDENDHALDYANMRKSQVYWPKAAKEIEGNDNYKKWVAELQREADNEEATKVLKKGKSGE